MTSYQVCRMSCQSSSVGVLWRRPSAMWRVTQRVSFFAAITTAGAGALQDSQNATVPLLTSKSWRITWKRTRQAGITSIKSLWYQVCWGSLLGWLWTKNGFYLIVTLVENKNYSKITTLYNVILMFSVAFKCWLFQEVPCSDKVMTPLNVM